MCLAGGALAVASATIRRVCATLVQPANLSKGWMIGMNDLKDFRIEDRKGFKLSDMPTTLGLDKSLRAEIEEATLKVQFETSELQSRLYAEGREGIVVLLQAMDAGGKDSTIKHVMSGLNPQGVKVVPFKQPTEIELSHDYLWRASAALPARGMIAVFNRSYYEDVLIVDVHSLHRGYKLPERCLDMSDREFFERRYAQIRWFEDHLYWNGYRLLKIFLNLSYEKQRKRFLERIEEPDKNWKFSAADIAERDYWDDYQKAYQRVIRATSTKENPWHVIPADQKWVARHYVSLALKDVLKKCDSRYPVLSDEEMAHLAVAKEQLMAEMDGRPKEG